MKIIKLLFLSLFIVFPFGQLTRLPLGIPSVNVSLIDPIIVLILLVWLCWHILKKKKIKLPPLAKPIFGFISIAFISWALNIPSRSSGEAIIALLYLLRWVAYAGIYFVTWDISSPFHGPFTQMLVWVGLITSILGLLQYFFLPDTRFLYYSGWDEHYYRVIGSFLDPGFTGMIYVLALILLISLYWEAFYKRKSLFTVNYSLLTILYLAFALTYSRASYLAFLVGMGVIAWMKKSWKFFVAVFLVLVITVLLLPRPGGEGVTLTRSKSVEARVRNYKNVLKIVGDHPVLGVGFNFYRYAQRDYGALSEDWQTSHAGAGADSSLFFVLATTGILGLVFYLWLLWEMVKIRPTATLALIAHSFFNNSLFYSWIMLWMWILLGAKESKQG